MAAPLEREIKLRFDSPAEARAAVIAAGATLVRSRRLQSDVLLDTDAGALRDRRCALRVRIEPERAFLTFKGAPQPSSMKLREELETFVGDGDLLIGILERLGFTVCFRYEKYREEFGLADVTIAIDETPVGTYVEIEGSAAGIHQAAAALGRGPLEYVLSSYRALFVQHCADRGVEPTHMLFEAR
jgi:adenylate cyclase, class 2